MIELPKLNLLDDLNPQQKEAVTTIEGPVMVVAGAGSGKTRVITYRIAYLLMQAHATSANILALTFTNKAAGEMKARVQSLAGAGFQPPLISTFHSFCALLLRRHISLLGYSPGFAIYDEEDQVSVIKECLSELNRDTRYSPRDVQYFLKRNKIQSGKENEIFDPNIRQVLDLYRQKLKSANAVDFEDLLVFALRILNDFPEVLERYRSTFRFIMVDEYQDTNDIQYSLLRTLAGPSPNMLAVGDEDQSIYKFRGARPENIQQFLRDYPSAKLIKLEQNYRSTKTIIKAAQAVISKNSGRIKKELWTDNTAGEPLEVYHASDEYDEANFVTLRVMAALQQHNAREVAVLYRANAQSRVFEESFGKAQIPHRVVGSVGFYERREIKDLIAFLRLLANPNDSVSFLRVINVPPRGAGKKMIEKIQEESAARGISLFEAARQLGSRPLSIFCSLFDLSATLKPSAFLEDVMARIEYAAYLKKEDPVTSEDRLENIAEFMAFLRESEAQPTFELNVFLNDLPLQSRAEKGEDAVTLLTVHSAKGLEFRVLFVAGMEEGLFPHIRSVDRGEDVEEERRLFYVAMTRAKEKLHLSWAQRRGMMGGTGSGRPSRFLEEIPQWFKVNRLSERFGAVGGPGRAGTAPPKTESASASDAPFRIGSAVSHEKFGRGTVLNVEGAPNDWKLTIRFSDGIKKIMTRFAQITILRR